MKKTHYLQPPDGQWPRNGVHSHDHEFMIVMTHDHKLLHLKLKWPMWQLLAIKQMTVHGPPCKDCIYRLAGVFPLPLLATNISSLSGTLQSARRVFPHNIHFKNEISSRRPCPRLAHHWLLQHSLLQVGQYNDLRVD